MVRCTRCRFLFEPPTPGLLPDCRQCGGATMQVHKLEAFDDVRSSPPTLKFAAVKVESGAG